MGQHRATHQQGICYNRHRNYKMIAERAAHLTTTQRAFLLNDFENAAQARDMRPDFAKRWEQWFKPADLEFLVTEMKNTVEFWLMRPRCDSEQFEREYNARKRELY